MIVKKEEKYPLEDVTQGIIGCAIEVHSALGPGLLEKHYEEALAEEFALRGMGFERQKAVVLSYKGKVIGQHRIDFLVNRQVVLEIKATDGMHKIFEAQLLTYMKALRTRIGLLINFNVAKVTDGIRRMIL